MCLDGFTDSNGTPPVRRIEEERSARLGERYHRKHPQSPHLGAMMLPSPPWQKQSPCRGAEISPAHKPDSAFAASPVDL